MKDCWLKILVNALLYAQQWLTVATFSTLPNVHINTQSALYNSYLENCEDERANGDTESNGKQKKEQGYRFGDVTRGVIGAFQSKVNSLTGNETYKFGDLTKWLDAQAREGALQVDVAAKRAIMERVTAYTKRPDYKVGDITKEIIRRFEVGEYKKEDVWLFVRICLLIGGSASAGAATALPVKVLLELLEVSMASSVSEDLTSMLTNEINNRMKEFITGDRSYQFGDITKKFLLGDKNRELDLSQQVVGKVTGKEVIEFSDLSKNIILLMAGKMKKEEDEKDADFGPSTVVESGQGEDKSLTASSLNDAALKEFEVWEKKYLAAVNRGNRSISDKDYKMWDEIFVRTNDR